MYYPVKNVVCPSDLQPTQHTADLHLKVLHCIFTCIFTLRLEENTGFPSQFTYDCIYSKSKMRSPPPISAWGEKALCLGFEYKAEGEQ